MQQTTHLRLARSTAYPWELTDETRQVGKQGLARVRAILDSKLQGPAQQELQLDFAPPATVTPLPSSAMPTVRRPIAA